MNAASIVLHGAPGMDRISHFYHFGNKALILAGVSYAGQTPVGSYPLERLNSESAVFVTRPLAAPFVFSSLLSVKA